MTDALSIDQLKLLREDLRQKGASKEKLEQLFDRFLLTPEQRLLKKLRAQRGKKRR